MAQALPVFRFHPDPVRSGSVERATTACLACGQMRGFVYVAGCYASRDLDRALCPWCIADGTAHARFAVVFHELDLPLATPPAVVAEIEQRTPGFATLNPFDWPACCGLPMAYREPAGIAEIRCRHPAVEPQLLDAIAIRFSCGRRAARRLMQALARDGDPCAHVFSCIVCGTSDAVVDAT